MKEKMKAVLIYEHGGVDKLRYEEIPIPEIAPDEILLRVKAISINHLDLWVRKGLPSIKLPLPHVLGSDAAGEIAQIGSAVKNVKVGDAVLLAPGWGCGTCPDCLRGNDNYCRNYQVLGETTTGCYAEYVKAPAQNAFSIPAGLDFAEAAAIPLVFLTAWHMLVTQVKVQPGETVLLLGAGSGVGSAGLQIAKLFGAQVIATAGSAAKLELAKTLGADEIINHHTQDFLAEVKRLTGKRGVDIVFEHVGKATWERSIKALRRGGRLVTCGATTGYEAITDLRYVFFKELKIFGNFMGRISDLRDALQFFPDKLKPVVDKKFPLQDAAAAHSRVEQGEHFGKVILEP